MQLGIILKGIGGFYYVKQEKTEDIFECKPRGVFRKNSVTPLPGDRVGFSIIDGDKKLGNIDEILPRSSELVRPAVANVDQIAIIVAAKAPNPDYMLLDKLLITAETRNIRVLICVNKIDLDDDTAKIVRNAYSPAGYDVIEISSVRNIGYKRLKEELKGHITVFAGQSGVGKSTILNHIMESWVMETGSVSNKIERGKHTTRHAELLELKYGGYVADTPGFSSFEIIDIPYNQLERYYPEFLPYINTCRFNSCSHITEPGCRVIEALERSEIDNNRYQRYIQLYKALKDIPQYKGKKTESRRVIK
ncbi:ribosome small subunit-dependent GTPase A [Ruminiclostridium cellulolyticum]|uniref:Small ribosomal subunit biogenesis GTPase RsgA n=1 Tax=Ruminiclostridium cellulolyticum (strain ATCC 35319 / DSM 5812 / JCM 6584 / H10) TaxID=394503 RepID=RSGA_RUMCH|nr:ribosome small subunit-dependent GTPase A [Ruminiclostridium cellulolyticum]B8I262.1 RecName: Full=Small ribosomal subunit biogenesis GTPase RsgA [Ruminiclostridium cellulolyticum H10]ACL75888.1 ribosome small subunit-dependent GTPase A [Ruminiclostridium cellulolyticum H10]